MFSSRNLHPTWHPIWDCKCIKYIFRLGYNKPIRWVVPLPSNSDHQDYFMFSIGDSYKPSFATTTGKGDNPTDMGVSKNAGTPKWMVYHGNPFKMDDLGNTLFWKQPYSTIRNIQNGKLGLPGHRMPRVHLKRSCSGFGGTKPQKSGGGQTENKKFGKNHANPLLRFVARMLRFVAKCCDL